MLTLSRLGKGSGSKPWSVYELSMEKGVEKTGICRKVFGYLVMRKGAFCGRERQHSADAFVEVRVPATVG